MIRHNVGCILVVFPVGADSAVGAAELLCSVIILLSANIVGIRRTGCLRILELQRHNHQYNLAVILYGKLSCCY